MKICFVCLLDAKMWGLCTFLDFSLLFLRNPQRAEVYYSFGECFSIEEPTFSTQAELIMQKIDIWTNT